MVDLVDLQPKALERKGVVHDPNVPRHAGQIVLMAIDASKDVEGDALQKCLLRLAKLRGPIQAFILFVGDTAQILSHHGFTFRNMLE